MAWPNILIKVGIVAGKAFGSLGLPYVLPIRKPNPLPVRIVKWYFLLVILPALFLVDPTSIAGYIIGGVGTLLGAWALGVILYEWRTGTWRGAAGDPSLKS